MTSHTLWKSLVAGVTALGAIVAFGMLSPAVASAATHALSVPTDANSSYIQIINNNSGKCLDMTGGSDKDLTPAQQWGCNGKHQQYWKLIQDPNIGGFWVELKNNLTQKCISILDNSNHPGAAVVQWGCNSSFSDLYELWNPDCNGTASMCTWWNAGMIAGQPAPDGCCAMHPSGNGTSDGLKIYANVPDGSNGYSWHYGSRL
jgi:hypothetical protein